MPRGLWCPLPRRKPPVRGGQTPQQRLGQLPRTPKTPQSATIAGPPLTIGSPSRGHELIGGRGVGRRADPYNGGMPIQSIPDFAAPKRVLLAAPRGYCAGVDRAIEIVEVALATYGAPVYVRKQIVHNLHVVRRLEAKGAIFVDELDEVPGGSTVVFSAHGVAPEVHQQAKARDLKVIDATCPLVTKVHQEARKFAGKGYDIVLIGHEGHEEVIGTMGEAPREIHLVADEEAAERVEVADPERVAYLTQTTLSVDETVGVIDVLRERFPVLAGPRSDDICYATQNRQTAVKQLTGDCQLILVIGAENSSNSKRLVEVARSRGCQSYLIPEASALDPAWFEGVETVGVTSGASAPEWLVDELVEALRQRGASEVRDVEVIPEDVHFSLPRGLRQDATAAGVETAGS